MTHTPHQKAALYKREIDILLGQNPVNYTQLGETGYKLKNIIHKKGFLTESSLKEIWNKSALNAQRISHEGHQNLLTTIFRTKE
jgi:hypothetical protein